MYISEYLSNSPLSPNAPHVLEEAATDATDTLIPPVSVTRVSASREHIVPSVLAGSYGCRQGTQGLWDKINHPVSSRAASTISPVSENHCSSSFQTYRYSTGALSLSKVSSTRLRNGLSR